MSDDFVHPYIPNTAPKSKNEMLEALAVKSVSELLAVIPAKLQLNRPLRLPEPLYAEADLKRHVESILSKNKTCKDYLSFLGAGCWPHYVPAVCDSVAQRPEFLTAYEGDTYSDLGKWQAYFEYQSMLGELLELDVVSFPVYDWATAASYAIRMASRINGRNEVLISATISPERMSVIGNFCRQLTLKSLKYDRKTGLLDLGELRRLISSNTAAVYFENPSYLGLIEDQCEEISNLARNAGAETIVGVDPISLGVISPPGEYGSDIVCGDLQPLGNHMHCGGGLGGFIATRDEEKYVTQYPTWLVSISSTEREGEFGFGLCTPERTHFFAREKGNDFTGTGTALHGIIAGVFLALMGSTGMKAIGKSIIERSHYAAEMLSRVTGIEIPFKPHFFKEFVISYSSRKKVSAINKSLLEYKIFGGKDLTKEFPELGRSSLYCFTETHTKNDIDRLVAALRRVLKE